MTSMKSREELEKIFARISQDYTFDDAHLELASDERMDATIKFVKEEFSPDEPQARSLNFVFDEEMYQLMRHVLRENLSVLLVSNSTDEIIAVRISNISEKDENMDALMELSNKKAVTMFTFTAHKDGELNAFDKYGVDKIIHFHALGVDRRHRRKGIATKIMDAAIKFYAEVGLDPVVIQGEASSNFSRRIYERFGFEILHELPYDDYKVDGEVVFKNTGEHKSCTIYTKMISSK